MGGASCEGFSSNVTVCGDSLPGVRGEALPLAEEIESAVGTGLSVGFKHGLTSRSTSSSSLSSSRSVMLLSEEYFSCSVSSFLWCSSWETCSTSSLCSCFTGGCRCFSASCSIFKGKNKVWRTDTDECRHTNAYKYAPSEVQHQGLGVLLIGVSVWSPPTHLSLFFCPSHLIPALSLYLSIASAMHYPWERQNESKTRIIDRAR